MEEILHIVCNVCGRKKDLYDKHQKEAYRVSKDSIPEEISDKKVKLWYTTGYPNSMPHDIIKRDIDENFSYLNKFFSIKDLVDIGAKKIFWVDTSLWIGRKFYHTVNHILETEGTFFIDAPQVSSYYTNDRFYKTIGKNKKDFNYKLVMGGAFGLNLNTLKGNAFYESMKFLVENKVDLWYGLHGYPWYPEQVNSIELGQDVLGHRHDQCVMGYILKELNIPFAQENFDIEGGFISDTCSHRRLSNNPYGPFMYDTDWVQEMLNKRTSEEEVIYYPNCCLTYHPTPYHEQLDRRIKEK